MNFRPCVTGRSLEYKLNRIGARTEPWGRSLRWGLQELVSLPMCTLKRRSQSSRSTSRVNSVCKEDQCARQCHMLLLSPERQRQSLGSAGIHWLPGDNWQAVDLSVCGSALLSLCQYGPIYKKWRPKYSFMVPLLPVIFLILKGQYQGCTYCKNKRQNCFLVITPLLHVGGWKLKVTDAKMS